MEDKHPDIGNLDVPETETPIKGDELPTGLAMGIKLFNAQGKPSGVIYMQHDPYNENQFELELEDELGDTVIVLVQKDSFKHRINLIEDRFEEIQRQFV